MEKPLQGPWWNEKVCQGPRTGDRQRNGHVQRLGSLFGPTRWIFSWGLQRESNQPELESDLECDSPG